MYPKIHLLLKNWVGIEFYFNEMVWITQESEIAPTCLSVTIIQKTDGGQYNQINLEREVVLIYICRRFNQINLIWNGKCMQGLLFITLDLSKQASQTERCLRGSQINKW